MFQQFFKGYVYNGIPPFNKISEEIFSNIIPNFYIKEDDINDFQDDGFQYCFQLPNNVVIEDNCIVMFNSNINIILIPIHTDIPKDILSKNNS